MAETDIKTMTVTEFANFVGVKTGTIYKWKCLDKLPKTLYRKVGNRKLIFIKNFVDEWVNNGAQLNQALERKSKNV